MARLLISPRAKADLVDIWDYIAEDDEGSADAFIARIDEKMRVLAGHPDMGRLREDVAAGLRSFPVGRYVVFYRAGPDGAEVIRVLHGARDLDAFFGEDGPT